MKLVVILILSTLLAIASAGCRCQDSQYFDDSASPAVCKDVTTPDENCVYYKKKDGNTQCNECVTGYYLDSDKSCKALPAEIANCVSAEKDGTDIECEKCEENYYRKDGKCEAYGTVANCSRQTWDREQSKAVCGSCNEGYYDDQNGVCQTNPTTDENCLVWYKYIEFSCGACKEGFYMDKTQTPNKCVALEDGFVKTDGCGAYSKAQGETQVKCSNCLNSYEYYEKSNGDCGECPYVYSESSASIITFGALFFALVLLF